MLPSTLLTGGAVTWPKMAGQLLQDLWAKSSHQIKKKTALASCSTYDNDVICHWSELRVTVRSMQ